MKNLFCFYFFFCRLYTGCNYVLENGWIKFVFFDRIFLLLYTFMRFFSGHFSPVLQNVLSGKKIHVIHRFHRVINIPPACQPPLFHRMRLEDEQKMTENRKTGIFGRQFPKVFHICPVEKCGQPVF